MILDEQGMQRARGLACELVRVEKEKNKEALLGAFEDIKNGVIEIWNSIKEVFEGISYPLSENEKRKHKWQVPQKILMTSQVLDRKPMLANIRNSI